MAVMQRQLQEQAKKLEQREDGYRGVVDHMEAQIDYLTISNLRGVGGGVVGDRAGGGDTGAATGRCSAGATACGCLEGGPKGSAVAEQENICTRA